MVLVCLSTTTSRPELSTAQSTPTGHLETAVRWVEPVANDNVKVISVLSTTPSGSTFPVYNSPHIVTYTATDSSGLTSTCVFNVTVLYEQHTINVTSQWPHQTIDTNVIA